MFYYTTSFPSTWQELKTTQGVTILSIHVNFTLLLTGSGEGGGGDRTDVGKRTLLWRHQDITSPLSTISVFDLAVLTCLLPLLMQVES